MLYLLMYLIRFDLHFLMLNQCPRTPRTETQHFDYRLSWSWVGLIIDDLKDGVNLRNDK